MITGLFYFKAKVNHIADTIVIWFLFVRGVVVAAAVENPLGAAAVAEA